MNKQVIKINNTDLSVKEFNGQRIVTFKDIDMLHERVEGTAKRNFTDNKKHFIEDVDYFELSKKDVGTDFVLTYGFDKKAPKGMLITESGYLMLVKSLQDDLAWKVQRELVNNYFRVKELITNAKPQVDSSIKEKEIEARYNNSLVRKANLLLKIAKDNPLVTDEYKKVLQSKATEIITGQAILPLPLAERKTYSATEIGQKLGISANKVGSLANKHNLKTEEYGKLFHDKSPYSAKEVESFRYYEEIIPVLESLI